MKKNIVAQIVLCTFLGFTSLSSYAGATNSDGTTAVNPGTESQSMSTTDASEFSDRDDNEGQDYSWIGFLGLLGLAGLMRKDRSDTTARPVAR